MDIISLMVRLTPIFTNCSIVIITPRFLIDGKADSGSPNYFQWSVLKPRYLQRLLEFFHSEQYRSMHPLAYMHLEALITKAHGPRYIHKTPENIGCEMVLKPWQVHRLIPILYCQLTRILAQHDRDLSL